MISDLTGNGIFKVVEETYACHFRLPAFLMVLKQHKASITAKLETQACSVYILRKPNMEA